MRSIGHPAISSLQLRAAMFCLAATAFALLPARASAQTRERVMEHCKSPSLHGIVYTNKDFGFRVDLPASWKGYRIEVKEWQGQCEGGDCDSKTSPPPQKGPIISIVHPLSTKENPRQDIPIMVFTLAQWKMVNDEAISVTAAPIGPGELARNAKYVFALPPRFDYADEEGDEEVQQIVTCDFLSAF
jgi:hypothetical protein